MILVSMERRDPTLYYNSTKQLYFGRVNCKFTGVVTPLGRRVTKKGSERRGLISNNNNHNHNHNHNNNNNNNNYNNNYYNNYNNKQYLYSAFN